MLRATLVAFSGLWFVSTASAGLLYDNGPFITNVGAGDNGADLSVLPSDSLGMASLGFNYDSSYEMSLADDFSVGDSGWTITEIVTFGYQGDSGTTSSFTSLNIRIWDGLPGNSNSTVIWGDLTTNVLTASEWTGAYRVSETTLNDTDRAIMQNTAGDLAIDLAPGSYWLEFRAAGDPGSFVYANPLAEAGVSVPGNAVRSDDDGDTYDGLHDGGNFSAQGFPFIINGVTPIPSPAGIAVLAAVILVHDRRRP